MYLAEKSRISVLSHEYNNCSTDSVLRIFVSHRHTSRHMLSLVGHRFVKSVPVMGQREELKRIRACRNDAMMQMNKDS